MASSLYARYIPPPKVETVAVSKPSRNNQPTKRKIDIQTQEQDAVRENDPPLKKRKTSKRSKVQGKSSQGTTQPSGDILGKNEGRTIKKPKRRKKLEEPEANEDNEQPTSEKSASSRDKHTKKKSRRKGYGADDGPGGRTADNGNLSGDGARADEALEGTMSPRDVSKNTTETDVTSSDDVHEETCDQAVVPPTESNAIIEPRGDDAKHSSVMSKFHKSSIVAELFAKKKAAERSRVHQEVEQPIEATQVQGLVPLPQPAEVPDSIFKPAFSGLPSWLARPILVKPTHAKSFSALGVSSKLASALEAKGYKEALPIQSTVLPLLLKRSSQSGDVCISAATGSGKTLAYVLPIIETLRSRIVTNLKALIVLPTRELVAQVREVFELCAGGSGIKVGTAVGNRPLQAEQDLIISTGQKYDPQAYEASQSRLNEGTADGYYDDFNETFDFEHQVETLPGYVVEYTSKIDVLICTPGRLVDHIQSTPGFTLDHIQWLVVDEADRLLNQSFQDWVDVAMKALEGEKPYDQLGVGDRLLLDMGYRLEPKDIRKVFLSATMTKDVEKLSAFKLRRPQLVVLNTPASDGGEAETGSPAPSIDEEKGDPEDAYALPATLQENAVAVGEGNEKPLYLLQLLLTRILPEKTAPETNRAERLQPSENSDGPESSEDETSSISSSASLRSSTTSSHCNSDSNSSKETSVRKPKTTSKAPLELSSPQSPHNRVLVFTNNNENATRLTRLLSIIHPPFSSHIGTLTKSSATSTGRKTLAAFRSGKLSILIASDRASRGLDVPNLAHVVNYDIPTSVTGYVHRVGRTARAGEAGEAWTFTSKTEARWFWNEIAKGSHVRRAKGRKIVRVKISVDDVGHEGRERYERALQTLREEVQGPQ